MPREIVGLVLRTLAEVRRFLLVPYQPPAWVELDAAVAATESALRAVEKEGR